MVKFYDSSFTYDYSFPAVSLAYFLRYPNPYANHVLSTDVIDRRLDPITQRLHTVRLHLKRSKLPPAVLKLLPKSILRGTSNGSSQAYILEKSVVDVKEGWMETETRNLEWTGVLSVVEKQLYRRALSMIERNGLNTATASDGGNIVEHAADEKTDVTTTATFHSRLGQARALRQKATQDPPTSITTLPSSSSSSTNSPRSSDTEDEAPPKQGFFQTWSTASIQRSIEIIGVRRTRDALVKSKVGMDVVLERLRGGGLVAVLEGMRRDREAAFGSDGPYKRVWQGRGGDSGGEEEQSVGRGGSEWE
ncbi:MAG: hypothetical protein M1827_003694 [Pycnora praestabilis]|nr:MAG: hypothetical protein M1827_003694 [Pycnora praestabilis]